ncbi:hydroxyacylglutathione hydrolase [Robbsia andropogonis]
MMPPASSSVASAPSETYDVFPLPAFNDNYIWMLVPQCEAALPDAIGVTVVDPGQAAPVIAYLEAGNRYLSAILLTHHHADHVGGVAELLAYTERQIATGRASALPPVYGPAGEDIATVTQPIRGGDIVATASPRAHFTVIDVPGHTRAHIAYFEAGAGDEEGTPSRASDSTSSREGRASGTGGSEPTAAPATAVATIDRNRPPRVFCGDTLFATGCGRLFEGTPAQMLASLDRLTALPAATLVHCAHEYTLSNIRFALAADPENADLQAWSVQADALRAAGTPTVPTTLAHERRVNPFLRADAPAIAPQLRAVMAARQGEQAAEVPLTRLAAFTQLRAWKDRF